MPKMEWKLKDPKYCNGCDLLDIDTFEPEGQKYYQCSRFDLRCDGLLIKYDNYFDTKIDRPQSCVDKFGE